MKGLEFLDLAIGLIFIYLIYSIACSAIWEIIANWSQLRGKMLRKWFFHTFKKNVDTEKLGEKIVNHPLIKGLSKSDKKLPSYISSGIFSDVLTDLIVNPKIEDIELVDINTFRDKLKETKLLPEELNRVFLQYITEASGSMQKVKEKIGKWYDDAQERLIGSYKKRLHTWILVIAAALVFCTNADTISLASYLYNNADARAALANKATEFVQDTVNINKIKEIDTTTIDSAKLRTYEEIVASIDKNVSELKELDKELKETGIPIGWENVVLKELSWAERFKKLGGLLLTVFAVSLGSPFWFEILSKLANLRSVGEKPKIIKEKNEQ